MRSNARTLKISTLALLILSATRQSAAQDRSPLVDDIAWSIAHEGCDLYDGNSQRTLSRLRECFLKTHRDSQRVTTEIEHASPAELSEAIKHAIEVAITRYQIEQNFDWVLVHEGKLQSFRDLAAAQNFRAIRNQYYTLQNHNPDASHNLSALSDEQIAGMLGGTRVSLLIQVDAELPRLIALDQITPSGTTQVDHATTLADFIRAKYGAAPENLLALIEQKNPSLAEKPKPNQQTGEIKLVSGDKLSLPSFPQVGTPTAMRISPEKNQDVIRFLAATSAEGPKGITAELDVSGEIEQPVVTLTQSKPGSVTPPTVPKDDGWYLDSIGLRLLAAGDLSLVTETVVGVIDGGADLKNPYIANHLWKVPPAESDENWIENEGYDFYNQRPNAQEDENSNSHGTHVSGLVVGVVSTRRLSQLNQALGSRIKIAELKIAGAKPQFSMTIADNCIRKSYKKNLEIFNVSFRGEYSNGLQEFISDPDRISRSLFVVAAGNESASLDADPKRHKSFRDSENSDANLKNKPLKNVIFVAALGRGGRIATFSNYGPETVQIAAPGQDILSTIRDGRFKTLSGTSQAAPFVTMTAAIIHAEAPNLSWQEIKQRILDTCDWVPDLVDFVKDGCRLNVLKATIRMTDLVELKAGDTLIKGKILLTETAVPDAVTSQADWEANLERIWINDSNQASYVSKTGRIVSTVDANQRVRIDTKSDYHCPESSAVDGDPHRCLIPISSIRDVVFHIPSP